VTKSPDWKHIVAFLNARERCFLAPMFLHGRGVGTIPRVSRGNGVEKYVKPAVIAGTGTMLTGILRAWVKLTRISRGPGIKSQIMLQKSE